MLYFFRTYPIKGSIMTKLTPEARALKFIMSRKTAILATRNASGQLWTSVAPFILYNRHFYIASNLIAQRTRDLLETSETCLMLCANEENARNLFALERFTLRCAAVLIAKHSSEWEAAIQIFYERFGKTFDVMAALPDFYLFRLDPLKHSDGIEHREHGRYVHGFARAYDILPYFVGSTHVKGTH